MLKFSNASLETEPELRDNNLHAEVNGGPANTLTPGSQIKAPMMRALLAEDDRLSQSLMVRHKPYNLWPPTT
jgi:hypothetical protein